MREVTADVPRSAVYDYLADFTTINEWDPRASSARRLRGDGDVGTTYECQVSFARRTVPMRYTVTRLVPGDEIEWIGESSWVRAHDTIVTPVPTGVHPGEVHDELSVPTRIVVPGPDVASRRLPPV